MADKVVKALLPVYLVSGADELKRSAVVKRLRKRLSAEGDLEFNSDVFDGESASGVDIVTACNILPFASSIRLVLVNSTEKLSKADQESLTAYVANPSPTTVLCLVAASLAKNTRLYKAVAAHGAGAIIDCSPPKRGDLPALVRSMATTHGVTITPGAASSLVDLVGENTVELDTQLAKLALSHVGHDPINETEVVSLVARTAELKPWDFTDAFSERNLNKCILVRSRLSSVTPHALLAQCVTRIRELLITRSLLKRGRVGDLASVLNLPAWRVKRHPMWARGFTSEQLRQALVLARDAERSMKSGSDAESTFQNWVIQVIG